MAMPSSIAAFTSSASAGMASSRKPGDQGHLSAKAAQGPCKIKGAVAVADDGRPALQLFYLAAVHAV